MIEQRAASSRPLFYTDILILRCGAKRRIILSLSKNRRTKVQKAQARPFAPLGPPLRHAASHGLRIGLVAAHSGMMVDLERFLFCLNRWKCSQFVPLYCAGGAGGKPSSGCGDGDGDGGCGSCSGARGEGLSIISLLPGSGLGSDVSGLSPKIPRRASTALRPTSS